MKSIFISLILLNGNLLKIELFDKTCARFWEENVIEHERIIKVFKKNQIYHTYKGQEVVGYHCSEKEII